mmetsp:Transcript_31728/g.36441  ORF Transcript_31728/g.36441 Transcript_31728/m.36441 type:complete len:169 (-) Transcript_31728:57-563(-)
MFNMKSLLFCVSSLCTICGVNSFAPIARQLHTPVASLSSLKMFESGVGLLDVELVPSIVAATPSLMISETEAWVRPFAAVLGPFLNIFSFAMLCRVVISWYPSANLNETPYNIVAWPTEPLLRLIRGSVPPAFGVDITPIVWLAIFTFFNEILIGQQGLLTMKIKYGI